VEGAEEFVLVRDFAIIMAVAGGVVVLFRRFNQPPILGYLIAGLLIGPFTFPRPPITNLESIRLLADLGLVLLLFAVAWSLAGGASARWDWASCLSAAWKCSS
jgi:Kef-type K+ transport system membrane component KefB